MRFYTKLQIIVGLIYNEILYIVDNS